MPKFAFKTAIRLLSADAGGRGAPVVSGYQPAVWFGDTGPRGEPNGHSVVLELPGGGEAQRGRDVQASLIPIALETWPTTKVGTQFDLLDGTRTIGHGQITEVPKSPAMSAELRRALHGVLEDWVSERFGDRVTRGSRRGGRLQPDLVALFQADTGERFAVVAEVVARRPWKRDIERLARIMKQESAIAGLVIGLDSASPETMDAVRRYGTVDLGRGHRVPRIRLVTTRDLITSGAELLPGLQQPDTLELVSA